MIFASVGSMLPYDRFVAAVDEWAGAHPDVDVFIQIGEGEYEPRNAPWARIVTHQEYMDRLRACRLFVAHVGMGSIFQALELQKQMVMMPRRADLREHTTDHQLHTAARFRDIRGLRIVDEPVELKAAISELLDRPIEDVAEIAPFAQPQLLDKIASFIGRS